MFRRFALLLAAPLILAAAATPPPTITQVSNAGSWRTAGLSASGIAQGSIFTILGNNLGPASCANPTDLPLPTQLCNVTLSVTVNGTSVAPYIYDMFYGTYISAILPSLTPTGTGTITVTYNNQTSAAYPIQVVTSAFGTFTTNSAGLGQASVTDANYNLNTIIHTLHPGDVGILWGTGLGPISGSDANTPPVGNIGSPTVYVGNTPVAASSGLQYAGRSGYYPGLDQINFTVPSGVQGCYVPIAVSAGGAIGNIGTIAVSAAGTNTCSDSLMGQDLVNKLASGGNVNFGYIRLEGFRLAITGISGTFHPIGDEGFASFTQFTPQTASYAEYGVSSGYCTGGMDQEFADLSIYLSQLDAGSTLPIAGPLVAPGPFTPLFPGYYQVALDTSTSFYYLSAGESYTVAGTGGANVGSFQVTDTMEIPTAKLSGISSSGATFQRSSDLTVQWTGGNAAWQNGQVTIGGYASSSDGSLLGGFQCTAPVTAQKFTIPAWVLSTLPQTGTAQNGSLTYPTGGIWIGQYDAPVTFKANGLDGGLITDVFLQGYMVNYQ